MASNVLKTKSFWHTSDAVAIGVAAIAIVLEVVFPSSFYYQTFAFVGGVVVLVASFSLLIAAKREFHKHSQSTKPGEAITTLITTGVFARYRNPIYVSVIANVYAVGLVVDSVWLALGAGVVWYILHKKFVLPEESFLTEQFGEVYRAYCARSRRWI